MKQLTRWKCLVAINSIPLCFKRYAETAEQAEKELLEFIKEKYEAEAQIVSTTFDKIINSVQQETQLVDDTNKNEKSREEQV